MARNLPNANDGPVNPRASRFPYRASEPIRLAILNRLQRAVLGVFGLILVFLTCTSTSNSERKPTWSRPTGHRGGVWEVAFSEDGRRLATGGSDGTVAVWDTRTGDVMELAHENMQVVLCLSFSADCTTLAVSHFDFSVAIWDVATGKRRTTINTQSDQVHSLAFSPCGTTLAGGGEQRTIRLWDVASGKLTARLLGHPGSVGAVRFAPNGRILASGCTRGQVKVWELGREEICERVGQRVHGGPVFSLAFSPDGSLLVSGAAIDKIRLWDLVTGKERTNINRLADICKSMEFSPDGKTVLSVMTDGAVYLSTASGSRHQTILPAQFSTYCAAFSVGGRFVATGGPDGIARVWDLADNGSQSPSRSF
jgi:WD40 repeat protein